MSQPDWPVFNETIAEASEHVNIQLNRDLAEFLSEILILAEDELNMARHEKLPALVDQALQTYSQKLESLSGKVAQFIRIYDATH